MSKWSQAFRDSRWQEKRLLIMQRDEFTCRSCGKKEGVTLNVHHIYYEKNRAPWEYKDEVLITWCEECHTKRHEMQKKILVSLATESSYGRMIAMENVIVHCQDIMNTVFDAMWGCGIDKENLIEMIDCLIRVSQGSEVSE